MSPPPLPPEVFAYCLSFLQSHEQPSSFHNASLISKTFNHDTIGPTTLLFHTIRSKFFNELSSALHRGDFSDANSLLRLVALNKKTPCLNLIFPTHTTSLLLFRIAIEASQAQPKAHAHAQSPLDLRDLELNKSFFTENHFGENPYSFFTFLTGFHRVYDGEMYLNDKTRFFDEQSSISVHERLLRRGNRSSSSKSKITPYQSDVDHNSHVLDNSALELLDSLLPSTKNVSAVIVEFEPSRITSFANTTHMDCRVPLPPFVGTFYNDSVEPSRTRERYLFQTDLRRSRGSGVLKECFDVFERTSGRHLMHARLKLNSSRGNLFVISEVGVGGELKTIGRMQKNFSGTEFRVFAFHDDDASPSSPHDTFENLLRTETEVGGICYQKNYFGNKPRVMTAYVTDSNSFLTSPPTIVGKPSSQKMAARMTRPGSVKLHNCPPRWNEAVSAYVLNFYGRVTQASVKNFQIVRSGVGPDGGPGGRHDNDVMIQFGRTGCNHFSMDYKFVSPLQAFAIALSSLTPKFACG